MKSIGGMLGAASLLLLLATAGSAMFPEETPNWTIMLGAAVACGLLSVIAIRQSSKSKE